MSQHPKFPVLASGRRGFLKKGAAVFGAAGLAGPLSFMATKATKPLNAQGACGTLTDGPFGPVRPVRDRATGLPLIQLPRGFAYTTFSWTGDTMTDGNKVRVGHDGMAVVAGRGRSLMLIRNHETFTRGVAKAPINQVNPSQNYDTAGGGGTTVLHWRGRGISEHFVSISGTIANCAGGRTPHGTWLTCEEEVQDEGSVFDKDHGFIFESRAAQTAPVPVKDAGRFKHESVVVDPNTGIVYLTEDNSSSNYDNTRGASGYYRYLPNRPLGGPGSYDAGGVLEMLQAFDANGDLVTDLRDPACDATYDVKWLPISFPDSPSENGISGPFLQGFGEPGTLVPGATRFQRLEGSWWDSTRDQVVFCDTEGGPRNMADSGTGDRNGRGEGAIWRYDPSAETIECIFVSSDREVADNPDNVVVSPHGHVMLCEDGSDANEKGLSMLGLTTGGQVFEFARNNITFTQQQLLAVDNGNRFTPEQALELVNLDVIQQPGDITPANFRGAEWAGATFDPTGTILFVNIQTPGITFAIWGPFRRWRNGD